MLRIRIDKKIYPNGYQALGNLRLDIPTTGLYAIIGESGSGKSTLLNCISGIDEFDGTLFYDNKEIKTIKEIEQYRRNTVSTIFQDFRLIEELSVGDNISLASDIIGKKLDEADIGNLLVRVGLPREYKENKINELSYGQMQRIAIARAIAKEANIIVADEPTANLDSENANNIMALLQEIAKEKLVLIVTHNTELVERYCFGYVELVDGTVIKNTLPTETAECKTNIKHSSGKASFSLLGKLIKSQRKNYRKNIASIVVTIVFLLITAISLVFAQVTLKDAIRNTLNANDKNDRTVYTEFYDSNGDRVKIPAYNLGEKIGFCNLGNNIYYPKDIFTIPEYSVYLKTIGNDQKYYGNNLLTFNRVIFSDSLVGTGLKLVCGIGELKDNEVVIPSAVADILTVLGNTTEVFIKEKDINSYDDLLNCEFSTPNLLNSKIVKIVGIYQSPTEYVMSYGDYQKLKNKDNYDKMMQDVFVYNSVICSKTQSQEYVDGIVLDYAGKKDKSFKDALTFISEENVELSYKFVGSAGLVNTVDNIVKIKYYAIIPLAVLASALSILIIYITMSGNIARNKDEILTLRALGMSARSISKIYLFSTLILTAFEIVLVAAFTLMSIPLINIITLSFCPQYTFTIFGIGAIPLLLPMLLLIMSNILVICLSIMRLFTKSVETQVKEA